MIDRSENKSQAKQNIQKVEQISQVGKTAEEILPYLLSGDSDDFTDEL